MNIIHLFRNLKYGGCQTLALSLINSSLKDDLHYIVYLNDLPDHEDSMKSDFSLLSKKIVYLSQKNNSISNIAHNINALASSLSDVRIISWFYPYSLKLNLNEKVYHHVGMAALPITSTQWLKNNIVQAIYCRRFIRKQDIAIYASQHIRNSHSKFYLLNPITQETVYNGVSLEKFTYEDKKIPIRNFIMIGRLDGSKDFDSYIRLANLFSSNSCVKFDIAGSGDDLIRLKSINDSLNSKVNFLGNVSNINEKIHDYDSLIFLNRKVEGFGNVLVEGMLSGLLVISNNLGASKEIIDDKETGFLVDSHEQLISLIRSIISSNNTYSQIKERARNVASEKFNSQLCSIKYREILSK
ncbi:glycosyltransferase [Vibrio splendidus]